ncbi:adenosylcobalamin-dependent ribonucleoside-diphosphate reductase [Planctomycetota bacterium]
MEESALNHSESVTRRESLRLTENARIVLADRYLKKDDQGNSVETSEQLFERVAHHVAEVETQFGADEQTVRHWEDRFYNLMVSLKFLPNSPTLMNAGRSMEMLSACFVLPVPDSIEGIFDAVKYTAMIQKAGGGTGFAFDSLRPTGDLISSSGGKTSGPISFWRVLSETTNAIQQGAFRRGANMGMMNITHPDILKFLHAKQDLKAFNNYNISVKVTDAWMEQLKTHPDMPHVVQNPRTHRWYYLPRSLDIWQYEIGDLPEAAEPSDQTETELPPTLGELWTRRQIWQTIVENAHRTGEPGVAFIDRINQDNMTPQLGPIEATNPCGEQPLLAYEACNLGSINLAPFVRAANTEEGSVIAAATELAPLARIDFSALRRTVQEAVRFLDNVIEINDYQIDRINDICRGNRKIGLGVMGFADALYKLQVSYGSPEGVALGGQLMRFINEQAHQVSEELARQRGVFPHWQDSRWNRDFQRPQRNAAVTTVAPTGTLSIIADCSGGIEPMFSIAFTRHVLGGAELPEVNQVFQQVAQERGFYSPDLIQQIAEQGSLAGCEDVPDDVKRVFVCAHEIDPEWHIRMQAAFQEHCDAAISKTINFHHDATVDQVDHIYLMAHQLGCKGITVYRDGCRAEQPMSLNKQTKRQIPDSKADKDHLGLPQIPLEPIALPEIMTCIRVRQLTPFGNMHVKITVDPVTERELEVFAQLGKGGDLANSDLEAICRLLSLLLRCGGSLELAYRQLDGIGSSLTIPAREGRIRSLGDGLAKAMAKYQAAKNKFGLKALLLGEVHLASEQKHDRINNNQGKLSDTIINGVKNNPNPKVKGFMDDFKIRCPSCDGVLSFIEGCVTCYSCGFSQC